MKEENEERASFPVWVNEEERIVTFQETEDFAEHIFSTQEEKMFHVCNLCESGYRIL